MTAMSEEDMKIIGKTFPWQDTDVAYLKLI